MGTAPVSFAPAPENDPVRSPAPTAAVEARREACPLVCGWPVADRWVLEEVYDPLDHRVWIRRRTLSGVRCSWWASLLRTLLRPSKIL